MRSALYLRIFAGGIGLTLLLLGLTPAGASSANISHSYNTNGAVQAGTIVSLDSNNKDYVVPANTDNGKRLLGVAVAKDDSLIAVDAADDKTQVATSGVATVLVSTLNGDIKVGDQIAVSPFNGVGMKATEGGYIIGLAQTSFDSSSDVATTKTVNDKDGKPTKVAFGYARLSVSIGAGTTEGGGPELSGIQKLTKSLTGHVVSTARIIIGVIIAVVALIAIITLVYASIYGGIISIGRNPLAKFAVFRTMTSVMIMVALIALISSLLIFFLLR